MAKYRKKPIAVEAVQYTGGDYNLTVLQDFTGGQFFEVDPEDRGDDPEVVAEVWDKLHSTWVGVKLGDWIINGVQGEFYPCNSEVFADTYGEVEDGEAPQAA